MILLTDKAMLRYFGTYRYSALSFREARQLVRWEGPAVFVGDPYVAFLVANQLGTDLKLADAADPQSRTIVVRLERITTDVDTAAEPQVTFGLLERLTQRPEPKPASESDTATSAESRANKAVVLGPAAGLELGKDLKPLKR